MEAYARALRQLPTIIADNGGFDGSELISSLRAAHAKGNKVVPLSYLKTISAGFLVLCFVFCRGWECIRGVVLFLSI